MEEPVALLLEAALEHPLLLAPAGGGKTTLQAQLALSGAR